FYQYCQRKEATKTPAGRAVSENDGENGLPSRSVEAGRRKCNDLCLQETAQLPSSEEVQKTGYARHPSTAQFRRGPENWARKTPLNCRDPKRSRKLGTHATPYLPRSASVQKTAHAIGGITYKVSY